VTRVVNELVQEMPVDLSLYVRNMLCIALEIEAAYGDRLCISHVANIDSEPWPLPVSGACNLSDQVREAHRSWYKAEVYPVINLDAEVFCFANRGTTPGNEARRTFQIRFWRSRV
jgi:hypothetical protein